MRSTDKKWLESQMSNSTEWFSERIEYLKEFASEERAALFERTLSARTRYMTVCMENTFHPHNASALLRHCEAFGVQDIHAIETTCHFSPSVNIVRGTDKWLNLHRHSSATEAIGALKAEGYRIVATTPHQQDCTPETFDVERGKFALFFGTEHEGISEEVISEADEFLRIPMCGMVESLNVSASAAILIYMLSERVRATVAGWQLTEEEQTALMCRWLAQSISDTPNILKRKFGADSHNK